MSAKLRHNEFKDDLMWALPLGNGRIGAMQYGNLQCEQIEINEESTALKQEETSLLTLNGKTES